MKIPLDKITIPDYRNHTFNELMAREANHELMEALMRSDPETWTPIVVLGPNRLGNYRLVDGLRRVRAAQERKLLTINAITHL